MMNAQIMRLNNQIKELTTKLQNAERAIEIYKKMFGDACEYGELDDTYEIWTEECEELTKLGYEDYSDFAE